jgi:hypothetical protein
MTTDISIESLTIVNNGMLIEKPVGLLSLTMAYHRPNLSSPLLWTREITEIINTKTTNYGSEPWYKVLAFRQDITSKAVLRIEVVAVQDMGVVGKLIDGILKTGTGALAGLIPNPFTKSVFETIFSIPSINKQIIHLGAGILEIDPANYNHNPIIPLVLEKELKLTSTPPGPGGAGTNNSIPKGDKNGELKLKIS